MNRIAGELSRLSPEFFSEVGDNDIEFGAGFHNPTVLIFDIFRRVFAYEIIRGLFRDNAQITEPARSCGRANLVLSQKSKEGLHFKFSFYT